MPHNQGQGDDHNHNSSSQVSSNASVTTLHTDTSRHCLLATAIAHVFDNYHIPVNCRVLLGGGLIAIS